MDRELVIGALALQDKDAAVLRVLVRLLVGSMSLPLRFSEQLSACNIVFAPPKHGAALPCVVVQVGDGAPSPDSDPAAITVTTPLRMGNVMAALHEALARIHPPAVADQTTGLAALFDRLRHGMGKGGPLRCVVPLHSGHLLLIDAQNHQIQTAAPMDLLLSGDCHPGTLRPAGRVDEELLYGAPTCSLRDFVWRLAQRLVEAGAAPPPLPGAWRLRRWPEASGLMSPGHPRLAALLTAKAHTVPELSTVSGLPPLSVHWFMLSCQLLGLAEQSGPGATGDAPMRPQAVAPGWLGQLRERLKLW